MTVLEIVLLVLGGIVFVLSFLIPVRQEEASEEVRNLVQTEVKSKVGEEMEHIRGHLDKVVGETIEYAQEKTERSLERISNEKIMAVNEYSDTVLDEIHKNHKEVMFLYDMLNDKHESLKDAVSEAAEAVREVEEATREAEEARQAAEAQVQQGPNPADPAGAGQAGTGFQPFVAPKVGEAPAAGGPAPAVNPVPAGTSAGAPKAAGSPAPAPAGNPNAAPASGTAAAPAAAKASEEPKIRTLEWAALAEAEAEEELGEAAPAAEAESAPANPQEQLRDRILALHKLGIPSVQIAKQLGIGVGEVELIIGLHGGRSKAE